MRYSRVLKRLIEVSLCFSMQMVIAQNFNNQLEILSSNEQLNNENKPLLLNSEFDIFSLNTTNNINYDFYSNKYGGMNIPYASITDKDGNLYVTGGSSNENSPEGNFTTIKIDNQGNLMWESREPSAKYSVNEGMAITIDMNNDVIAAGTHWNGNDMDVQAIKYDSQTGNVIWEKKFDAGYAGLDIPRVITTDDVGNIYIAGITFTGNNISYLTLKYDTNGKLLWSAIADNSLKDSFIEPTSIVIDNGGNIIVTGYGGNENYYAGYYTIKYSPNGTEIWTQFYNYKDANGNETNSIAKSIVVDNNNNYYVTGVFDIDNSIIGTIKYNSNGNKEWEETYKVPNSNFTTAEDIIINDSGDIYIVGSHVGAGNENGIVLLSYDLNGSKNWVRSKNNLYNTSRQLPVFIKINSNGEPLVATMAYNAVNVFDQEIRMYHYDLDGELLQQKKYIRPNNNMDGNSIRSFIGMGVDKNDNIYLSLRGGYAEIGGVFEFMKFSLSDNNDFPEWNEIYSNEGRDRSSMMKTLTDKNNNLYVLFNYRTYEEKQYVYNLGLLKYDQNGDIIWEKNYNSLEGEFSLSMYSTAMMEIDKEDNIILYFMPDPLNIDSDKLKLKKINSNGDLIWDKEKNIESANLNTFFLDDLGDIYIAGSAKESPSDLYSKFAIIKFSSQGEELWTSYEESENSTDNSFQINNGLLNSNNEIVLTGYSGQSSMMSSDLNLIVLKYNTYGDLLWSTPIEYANEDSSGIDLVIDDDNNIYVAGLKETKVFPVTRELILAKLTDDGDKKWISNFMDNGRSVFPYSIELLTSGNLVISGSSVIPNENNKVILLKYDTDGNEISVNSTDFDHFFVEMFIDNLDNIYILNQIIPSVYPNREIIVPSEIPASSLWIIDEFGNEEYEIFERPELAQFIPNSLIPLNNESLIIGGDISHELDYFQGLYFYESIYTHENLGVEDFDKELEARNWLGQNYPNPVFNNTEIPFYLIDAQNTSLIIYDNLGREVYKTKTTFYNEGINTIHINLSHLKSGIYYYTLNGSKMMSRKLIKY